MLLCAFVFLHAEKTPDPDRRFRRRDDLCATRTGEVWHASRSPRPDDGIEKNVLWHVTIGHRGRMTNDEIEYTDLTAPEEIDDVAMAWDRFCASWVVIATCLDPTEFWRRDEDGAN